MGARGEPAGRGRTHSFHGCFPLPRSRLHPWGPREALLRPLSPAWPLLAGTLSPRPPARSWERFCCLRACETPELQLSGAHSLLPNGLAHAHVLSNYWGAGGHPAAAGLSEGRIVSRVSCPGGHRSCDLEGAGLWPMGERTRGSGGRLTLWAPLPSLRGGLAGSRLVRDQNPGPGPAAPLGSPDGNHRAVTHRQAWKPGEPRCRARARRPSPSRPAVPTQEGVQPSTHHVEMALGSSPAYHPGPRGAETGCRVAGGPLGTPQLRAPTLPPPGVHSPSD